MITKNPQSKAYNKKCVISPDYNVDDIKERCKL